MDDDNIFWLDLASAHYAKTTPRSLHFLKIPFVKKEMNAPNVPACSPIKNFWEIFYANIYKERLGSLVHTITEAYDQRKDQD